MDVLDPCLLEFGILPKCSGHGSSTSIRDKGTWIGVTGAKARDRISARNPKRLYPQSVVSPIILHRTAQRHRTTRSKTMGAPAV